MSAIATDDGAAVPELDGQLMIPAMSTRIRITTAANAARAVRPPRLARWIGRATDPVVTAQRLYQRLYCNPENQRYRLITSIRQVAPKSMASAGTRSSAPWISAMVMCRGKRIG